MVLKFSVLFLTIFNFYSCTDRYKGESFPVKYLRPDAQVPEYSDVDYYLHGISKILGAIAEVANETDINRALGTFYAKAILKKTMKENPNKIKAEQRKFMESIILLADDVYSHFRTHVLMPLTWTSIMKRAGTIIQQDDLQVDAIADFNRNRLTDWIFSNVTFNDYERAMDNLTLPKEMYLRETEIILDADNNKKYTISIDDSDYCIGEVIYNPMPLDAPDMKNLKPCAYDKFCSSIVYKRAPSFSYSLSHRMLNILLVHQLRRCYMRNPEDDTAMMEAMCSSMYREAVYIARRGYFNRDIWMEHIALCGLLGYEEFFRRHWFRKVVSWIDERGCIAENFNYEANRTMHLMSKESEPEKQKKIRDLGAKVLASKCHWHPMALSMVVLAHGVRHAVHFSEVSSKDEL